MEIKQIKRPTTKRGRKGELKVMITALRPNTDDVLPLSEKQASSAYQAAKSAGVSISVHKLTGEYAGHIGVYSNGPRKN